MNRDYLVVSRERGVLRDQSGSIDNFKEGRDVLIPLFHPNLHPEVISVDCVQGLGLNRIPILTWVKAKNPEPIEGNFQDRFEFGLIYLAEVTIHTTMGTYYSTAAVEYFEPDMCVHLIRDALGNAGIDPDWNTPGFNSSPKSDIGRIRGVIDTLHEELVWTVRVDVPIHNTNLCSRTFALLRNDFAPLPGGTSIHDYMKKKGAMEEIGVGHGYSANLAALMFNLGGLFETAVDQLNKVDRVDVDSIPKPPAEIMHPHQRVVDYARVNQFLRNGADESKRTQVKVHEHKVVVEVL